MAHLRNGKIHVYDVQVDEFREITLADVERMEIAVKYIGLAKTRIHEFYADMMDEVRKVPDETKA